MERMIAWFYGGQSKEFFKEEENGIHDYNANIMNSLLFLMAMVLMAFV